MSDFYENPDNLRLLQKAQLKEQSGMDIKADVIQLMQAAFDSLADEDWEDYNNHQSHFNDFLSKYSIELSPIPLVAIKQLVQQLSDIIPEILACDKSLQSDYHDLVLHLVCEIANKNDLCHQMPDLSMQELNEVILPEPSSREEYCKTLSSLCSEYSQIQDFHEAGNILIKIYRYAAYYVYV